MLSVHNHGEMFAGLSSDKLDFQLGCREGPGHGKEGSLGWAKPSHAPTAPSRGAEGRAPHGVLGSPGRAPGPRKAPGKGRQSGVLSLIHI